MVVRDELFVIVESRLGRFRTLNSNNFVVILIIYLNSSGFKTSPSYHYKICSNHSSRHNPLPNCIKQTNVVIRTYIIHNYVYIMSSLWVIRIFVNCYFLVYTRKSDNLINLVFVVVSTNMIFKHENTRIQIMAGV